MKHFDHSIKTTSFRNRCRTCPAIQCLNANPNYHTAIVRTKNLIKNTKKLNYHWQHLLLSGGKILLWRNCLGVAKLLYNSGICSRLIFLTNGLQIKAETLTLLNQLAKTVHEIRVFGNNDNSENILLAIEHIGKLKNKYGDPVLSVVDHRAKQNQKVCYRETIWRTIS